MTEKVSLRDEVRKWVRDTDRDKGQRDRDSERQAGRKWENRYPDTQEEIRTETEI